EEPGDAGAGEEVAEAVGLAQALVGQGAAVIGAVEPAAVARGGVPHQEQRGHRPVTLPMVAVLDDDASAASICARRPSVSERIAGGGSRASKRSSSRAASSTRPLRKSTMARKAWTSGYDGSVVAASRSDESPSSASPERVSSQPL